MLLGPNPSKFFPLRWQRATTKTWADFLKQLPFFKFSKNHKKAHIFIQHSTKVMKSLKWYTTILVNVYVTPHVICIHKSKNGILSYLHIHILWFITNVFCKFQSNWMKNEILVNFSSSKKSKPSSEIISLKVIKISDNPCDFSHRNSQKYLITHVLC